MNKHRDDLNAVRNRILLDEKEYLDKQYAQQVANYNRQIKEAKTKGEQAGLAYAMAYGDAWAMWNKSHNLSELEDLGYLSSGVTTDPSGRKTRVYVANLSSGGYTGKGGKYEVADDVQVHRGEYVLPQEMVDQTTGTPKAMGNNITINLSGTFATSDSERRKVAQQIVAALEQTNYARLGA